MPAGVRHRLPTAPAGGLAGFLARADRRGFTVKPTTTRVGRLQLPRQARKARNLTNGAWPAPRAGHNVGDVGGGARPGADAEARRVRRSSGPIGKSYLGVHLLDGTHGKDAFMESPTAAATELLQDCCNGAEAGAGNVAELTITEDGLSIARRPSLRDAVTGWGQEAREAGGGTAAAAAAAAAEPPLYYGRTEMLWVGSPQKTRDMCIIVFAFDVPQVTATASSEPVLKWHAFKLENKFTLLELRSQVDLMRASHFARTLNTQPARPTPASPRQEPASSPAAAAAAQATATATATAGAAQTPAVAETSLDGPRGTATRQLTGYTPGQSETDAAAATATATAAAGGGGGAGAAAGTATALAPKQARKRRSFWRKKTGKRGTDAENRAPETGNMAVSKKRRSMLSRMSKWRFRPGRRHGVNLEAAAIAMSPMSPMSSAHSGGGAGTGNQLTPLSVARRGVAASAVGSLSRPVSAACVGEDVIINGYGTGKLAYYGAHKGGAGGKAAKGGMRCGIILDSPVGLNDGTVQGQRYFECEPLHGILVAAEKVTLASQARTQHGDTDMYGRKIKSPEEKRQDVADRYAEMVRIMQTGQDDKAEFTTKQVKQFVRVARANIKASAREEWNAKIKQAAREERETVKTKAREHIERIRHAKMKQKYGDKYKGRPGAPAEPALTKEEEDEGYLKTTAEDGQAGGGAESEGDDDGYLQTEPDADVVEEAKAACASGKPVRYDHMRALVNEAEATMKKDLAVELERLVQAARLQARTQAQQELVQKLSRKRNERTRSRKTPKVAGQPLRNGSYTRANSPPAGSTATSRPGSTLATSL